MKRISLLGSTGSIGVSTLDVVASQPGEFTVTALAAGRNVTLLQAQIERFRPALAVVADEEDAYDLRCLLGPNAATTVFSGPRGIGKRLRLSTWI